MPELLYLIIYDLPDHKTANKRRDRLHKLLSGYGTWTQYSVFECFLSVLQFTKLQIQIEKLINSQEDSVRIYVLNHKAIRQTITYGSNRPEKLNTLIL
jgi:CRISPR-associated protein Cas2